MQLIVCNLPVDILVSPFRRVTVASVLNPANPAHEWNSARYFPKEPPSPHECSWGAANRPLQPPIDDRPVPQMPALAEWPEGRLGPSAGMARGDSPPPIRS